VRVRRRIGLRLHGALIVAVVVGASLAACSSGSKTAGSGSTPAIPSAWQQTLDKIGPDGTVDLPTALAAFSLAVGKVPGGNPPAGPVEPIGSGTLAVSWVLAHWAELSADQRTAVRTALGVPTSTNAPAAYVTAPSKQPNPNLPCQTADSAGAAPYRAQVAGIESELTAHLGRPLTIDKNVFLSVNTRNLEKNSLMYTWACTSRHVAATGPVHGCTIHINPRTIGGAFTADEQHSYLIHEMMHCYMYDKFDVAYDQMPAWYVEGAPTFAMETLGSRSSTLDRIWQNYLRTPQLPLTRREYDGLGFFVHLAETGTGVWPVIDPIGTAMLGKGTGATEAGWQAAGVGPDFVQSWGSGYVQGRYPGTQWTSTGANLPSYRPALKDEQLVNNGKVPVTSPAFAVGVRHLDIAAEVVLVDPDSGTGGRLSLGGGADTGLGGGPYCTVTNCKCPQGTAGADTTFQKIAPGEEYLGVSGGDKPGTVTLVGQSLADFCAKPPVSCLVGQWTSVSFDIATKNITEHGGAGARLHIDPQGNATEVFSGMAPIKFTVSRDGTTGKLTFSGTETGVVKLPPGGVRSGQWQTAGTGSVSGLVAHVTITSPVHLQLPPFDLGQLAAGAGGAAGGAVGNPDVTSGTWTCTGDTLVSTPPAASGVSGTWTLARTGPG
jgi:hypothetical protein